MNREATDYVQTEDRTENIESRHVRTICIKNVRRTTSEEEIRTYFSNFGEIEHMKYCTQQRNNGFNGICFIKFKERKSLESVIEQKDDILINGRKPGIEIASEDRDESEFRNKNQHSRNHVRGNTCHGCGRLNQNVIRQNLNIQQQHRSFPYNPIQTGRRMNRDSVRTRSLHHPIFHENIWNQDAPIFNNNANLQSRNQEQEMRNFIPEIQNNIVSDIDRLRGFQDIRNLSNSSSVQQNNFNQTNFANDFRLPHLESISRRKN